MREKLVEKIGEGRYRECFAFENSDLCVKRLKPFIKKNYFGMEFKFETQKYVRRKFGIESLNQKEFEIIDDLPQWFGRYIPNEVFLKDDLIYMSRPKDFDGSYSRTIQEHGRVDNPTFWRGVEDIVKMIEKNKLWFFDIFHYGNNLIVNKEYKCHWRPVVIDFKRLGSSSYPFQLNLRFEEQKRNKFYRRLNRFYDSFM